MNALIMNGIIETSYQVGNSTNYVQVSCHGACLHVRSAIIFNSAPSEEYRRNWVAEVRERFRAYDVPFMPSISEHPHVKGRFVMSIAANRKKLNDPTGYAQ